MNSPSKSPVSSASPRADWSTAAAVARARAALRGGGLVALVDVRSGFADLIAAASSITAEIVNALAVEGRGLPYLALSAERVDQLRLPPMASSWDVRRKPFTISIEARNGVTTGISAADRARTMRVATSPDAVADDLISPGHVFPLRARPPVLRQGIGPVEAALALVTGIGVIPGAAMTEILDDEGALAGPAYVAELGARIDVPVVTVGAVVRGLLTASSPGSAREGMGGLSI